MQGALREGCCSRADMKSGLHSWHSTVDRRLLRAGSIILFSKGTAILGKRSQLKRVRGWGGRGTRREKSLEHAPLSPCKYTLIKIPLALCQLVQSATGTIEEKDRKQGVLRGESREKNGALKEKYTETNATFLTFTIQPLNKKKHLMKVTPHASFRHYSLTSLKYKLSVI